MQALSLADVDFSDKSARDACLEQIWVLNDPVQIAVYLDQFVRKVDRVWQSEESVHGSYNAIFHS